MEEDVGVKVPTRLRRRMSVEQSEDGSSPAPSTPTKKRGGRLAAKPQLGLIDENTPVSSPRKTRRTSLATEAEEKTITPSRRSVRIKSNSSIVSETHSIQATESPRAIRAARRKSQAGSDNEGPATPARQTRRTRKDSTSSLESQGSNTVARPLPVVKMVIQEEPENEIQKSVNKSISSPRPATDEISPNSARKSKRLLEKRSSRSESHNTDHDCSICSVENTSVNVSTTGEKVSPKTKTQSHSPLIQSEKSKESNKDLSESNTSLLIKLDTESTINKTKHNKSVSALETVQNDKRNRTESWPSVTTPATNYSVNFSDNEQSKKRKEKSDKIKSLITSLVNTTHETPKIDKINTSINEKIISQSLLDTSSKRKKRLSETSFTKDTVKPEDIPVKEVIPPKEPPVSNKEITGGKSDDTDTIRDIAMLFEKPGNVQAIVYFEDSDSSSVGTRTANKIVRLDSEDQCVPVVKHDIQEDLAEKDPIEENVFRNKVDSDKVSHTDVSIAKVIEDEDNKKDPVEENVFRNKVDNDKVSHPDVSIAKVIEDEDNNSCEPMDIDETIHEEILQKSQESQKCKKERKSVSLSESTTRNDTSNSKRKSSISNSSKDTSDRSKNENKSTLILSQLKDVTSVTENLKSPTPIQTNEILSKSAVYVHEDNNNKISKGNLSFNDLKGTPKQKAIQKLTMQTSTPITTQLLHVATKTDDGTSGTKHGQSNFSKSIIDADSSGESASSDDEGSEEKSKLLDDEAEEASDNYESGDSQDEEERRYEAENEIVERGETLTSDHEVSNDTDYEKDSFIVSSDADDNELLSGSGDDLSMSDNELSMSKKSKKKFNERKLKEQKKASREMFESRHKLNTSDQKSPAKVKKNQMRIDSSLLASDEEVVVKPKKNNRMRLDSTLDISVQHDDSNASLKKSKNKNKSMQNSVHDKSAPQDKVTDELDKIKKNNKSLRQSTGRESDIDEKEITVRNEDPIDSSDPLQIQIKQEPKTPQKDLNISIVQFTDRQEIENVNVNGDTSIINQTGTDPLQTTHACEDTSDSSENEEIMNNYDSVLNELNKDNKGKLNNNNVSLIMGNKAKKSHVDPIVDQLNLTNTKKPKKNNNADESKTPGTSQKKPDSEDEDSSNSIDLQLLFSEDNCGSEDEKVATETKADQADEDGSMFIPLKKSPGTINIRKSIEMDISQKDASLNESAKKKKRKSSLGHAESIEKQDISTSQQVATPNESGKKKKRKSSLVPPEIVVEQDLSPAEPAELNKSSSKKKKENISLLQQSGEDYKESTQGDDDNVLNKSSSKKKKHKSSVSEPTMESLDIYNAAESVLNESRKKKKKRKSSLVAQDTEPTEDISTSQQVATPNESGKKKKRKSSLVPPEIVVEQDLSPAEPAELNKSSSKKKKENISLLQQSGEDYKESTQGDDDNVLNKSSSKKKKHKSSVSEPTMESLDINNAAESVLNESRKKKKKRKSSLVAQDTEPTEGDLFFIDTAGTQRDNKEDTTEETNATVTPKSEKKKKKKKTQKLESLVYQEDSDGAPDEAPYLSEKATDADLQNTESVSESAEAGSGKKKKKKKKMASAASDQSRQSIDVEDKNPSNSKKRKRKSSNAEGSHDSGDVQHNQETETINEIAGSHKKKRKISHNEDNNTSGASESKHSKKKKKVTDVNFQDTVSALENTQTQVKKSKKRKHRDEDGDSKQTKVSKENSFQEVHVPRLPDSILNQLDDKPRKSGAVKVISTTNFVVENARQKRAKPSNYLEESIYLDANTPKAKKEKPRIKKPKVLPFIPTASISDSGFTTNFKINKLSQATKFEAEPVYFSKETYLQNKKIKRLGTYDRYKKQIHHKMSKF